MTDMSQWMILLRTLGSLVLVIALIVFLSWVAKKYLRPETWAGTGLKAIKVLQTYPIEPKKKLLIVEVDSRRLLLGVAESSISTLCELDAAHSISSVDAGEEKRYGI
jgi:flagellar biosynthetic protein FliO